MAWRFKASKFKNAAPIVPKPENCIRDIVVGSYQTHGNNITASAAFMAFIWEHTGSSLAVLPLDDSGRKSKTMPLLHAHTDTITDLQFSPFHDGLLATSSQDCLVKIWHIPEKGLEVSLTDAECTFSHKQRRVETVGFHPTADFLIHSTSAGNINLWDISVQKEIFSNSEHPEVIQSASWKQDGTLLATSSKDKIVRILDPRIESAIVKSVDSHAGIKDSRVVWLGDSDRILTTGFDAARLRQVIIRDIRNFNVAEKSLELDCSTGILMPLFDPDTNMLFLAGKGDTTINYLEVTNKEPYLIEGLRHTGEQTKGACLVPKRALRVMEGEVNRVLQLVSNSVIPITYQVPRKSYRDFHSDLYPDTNSFNTELTASDWFKGINQPLSKITLDPAKRELGEKPIVAHRGNLEELLKTFSSTTSESNKSTQNLPNAYSENIVKPAFVPIKEKIKKLEQNNKFTGSEPEKSELEQKIKEIIYNDKKVNNNESTDENSNSFDHNNDSLKFNNENVNELNDLNDKTPCNGNGAIPPKPLPRTSRTNSVSDQGSDDTNGSGVRPVAKPRTATSGYKPRLGPKPFVKTSELGEFSFDNVFSVPQVHNFEPASQLPDSSDSNEDEKETEVELREITPSKSQDEIVNEENTDNTHKSIVTAERIKSNGDEEKMFEERTNESNENIDTIDEKKNNFERFSGNRNSIAERRRLYENKSQSFQEESAASPQLLRRQESFKAKTKNDEENDDISSTLKNTEISKNNGHQIPKRTSTVFGRVSKFRHLKGTPGHKSTNIENIRNISRQLPGECDGFHANHERVAIPVQGQGGKLAVFELSNVGRLADGVIPSLVNGNNIMDFQFDPFDPKCLVVACDDGIIKIWKITEPGLTESINVPDSEFPAHSDKIYFIRFHPLANGVFLTASYDMTIKLWNIEQQKEMICLTGHTDQIFCFAWSPCGKYGATVCKDGKIRIYDPRKSCQPIREGPGPVGSRGARIVWAINGNYIVVTGFDKVSERQISVFRATNLSEPLNTVGLDVSPAILIPFYDEDSSTLFVTGKGDSTIYAFEITDESPYICPLSHHKCSTSHQGLSFLMKNQCDVSIVEFCRALRLSSSTVEHLSFTVPRVKSELFQDDLFPPTRVLWSSTMTALDWFSGVDKQPILISLQPEGMESLSSQSFSVKKNNNLQNIMQHKSLPEHDISVSVKEKQEALAISVSNRLEINMSLEQDNMEGVDENEWVE